MAKLTSNQESSGFRMEQADTVFLPQVENHPHFHLQCNTVPCKITIMSEQSMSAYQYMYQEHTVPPCLHQLPTYDTRKLTLHDVHKKLQTRSFDASEGGKFKKISDTGLKPDVHPLLANFGSRRIQMMPTKAMSSRLSSSGVTQLSLNYTVLRFDMTLDLNFSDRGIIRPVRGQLLLRQSDDTADPALAVLALAHFTPFCHTTTARTSTPPHLQTRRTTCIQSVFRNTQINDPAVLVAVYFRQAQARGHAQYTRTRSRTLARPSSPPHSWHHSSKTYRRNTIQARQAELIAS